MTYNEKWDAEKFTINAQLKILTRLVLNRVNRRVNAINPAALRRPTQSISQSITQLIWCPRNQNLTFLPNELKCNLCGNKSTRFTFCTVLVLWCLVCYSGTFKRLVLLKAMVCMKVWTGYLKSCQSARCLDKWTECCHLLCICACCYCAQTCINTVYSRPCTHSVELSAG